jgi:hypothetical protein
MSPLVAAAALTVAAIATIPAVPSYGQNPATPVGKVAADKIEGQSAQVIKTEA